MTPTTSDTGEQTIWKGSPSQWVNAVRYVLCGLLTLPLGLMGMFYQPYFWLLLLPPAMALGYWYSIRSIKYEITTERIICTTGIFSRTTQYLEFFRVKDMTVVQPFWLRMVGKANLIFLSKDATTPQLKLWAVPNRKDFHDRIRTHILQAQDKRQVRFMGEPG
jgi:hypothetical protein